jgi:hypothetical protein
MKSPFVFGKNDRPSCFMGTTKRHRLPNIPVTPPGVCTQSRRSQLR